MKKLFINKLKVSKKFWIKIKPAWWKKKTFFSITTLRIILIHAIILQYFSRKHVNKFDQKKMKIVKEKATLLDSYKNCLKNGWSKVTIFGKGRIKIPSYSKTLITGQQIFMNEPRRRTCVDHSFLIEPIVLSLYLITFGPWVKRVRLKAPK